MGSILDCPLSNGNQSPQLKFERPNGKILESKFLLTSVKNWCVQLTWKLNEAISLKDLTRIKTNQNQVIYHFKSKTYSAAILSKKKYQLKVPKQLT